MSVNAQAIADLATTQFTTAPPEVYTSRFTTSLTSAITSGLRPIDIHVAATQQAYGQGTFSIAIYDAGTDANPVNFEALEVIGGGASTTWTVVTEIGWSPITHANGSTVIATVFTPRSIQQPLNNHTSPLATPDPHSIYVRKSSFTGVGQILAGTGSGTFTNLPIGADGTSPVADSTRTGGIKWAALSISNVLTHMGDLIIGGLLGTLSRLGIGTIGQSLQVVQNPAAITTPITAPTCSAVGSGGSLTNGVQYDFAYAWQTANPSPDGGLTAPSSRTTFTATTTGIVAVQCPAAPGTGLTLLVYASVQFGTLRLQGSLNNASSILSNTINVSNINGAGALTSNTNTTGGIGPGWRTGFTDPTTQTGDLIVKSGGVATRLPTGTTAGTVLTSNGFFTVPSYQPITLPVNVFLSATASMTTDAFEQVFGPSGPNHSQGNVPDPGSVAGVTRFLREDASWQVPPGTGGGGTVLAGARLVATASMLNANLPTVFGASGPGHGIGVVPDPGSSAGTTRFLREDDSWAVPPGSGGGSTTNISGGLVPIQTQSPSSGTSITFTVPAGYRNLRLTGTTRSGAAATSDELRLQFNGDTTSGNYVSQAVYGSGTGTASTQENITTQTSMKVANVTGGNGVANDAGAVNIEILDHMNTTYSKQVIGQALNRRSAATANLFEEQWGGTWLSTSAITSVTVLLGTGPFTAGTNLTLWGESDQIAVGTGANNLIQETILGSAQATISIPNIPQGYKDLKLEVIARGDASATTEQIAVQFNADTGSNYNWQQVTASDSGAPTASESLGTTSIAIGIVTAATATSGRAGSCVVSIPNYTDSTNFHKTVQSNNHLSFNDSTSNTQVRVYMGTWRSLNAITSLLLSIASGNFAAGTAVRLYGEPVTGLNPNTVVQNVTIGAQAGLKANALEQVFGPSGTLHAIGNVPDPGASSGSTRFLREDGTWATPPGTGGGGGGGSGASDLIAEIDLSSTQTISNIPQGYRGLRLDIVARSSTSAGFAHMQAQFNSDTTAGNYESATYQSTATSPLLEQISSSTNGLIGTATAATSPASDFAPTEVFIPDYVNTTANKGWRSISYIHLDTSTLDLRPVHTVGRWKSTSAITSITFALSAGTFVSGSMARLYAEPAISGNTTVQNVTIGATAGLVAIPLEPAFGPSGPNHSPGDVPDPGSVAGTTRFLREDATWVAPAGTGSGSPMLSSQLTSPVTMTNANQFYDGPSITLTPGTWFVIASAVITNTTSGDLTAKLWDGTTVFGSTQSAATGSTAQRQINVASMIVVATSTTYKLSVASQQAAATIAVTPSANATGTTNTATGIVAVQGGAASTGSSNLIQETILSSAQSSISIPNIPQTYKDLRLTIQARGTTSATSAQVQIQFNGDTGSNYDDSRVYGSNTAGADVAGPATVARIGEVTAATGPANAADVIILQLPNYTGSTFRKDGVATSSVVRSDTVSGNDYAAVERIQWRSTAAITSALLTMSAGNFDIGTTVRVYGEPVTGLNPNTVVQSLTLSATAGMQTTVPVLTTVGYIHIQDRKTAGTNSGTFTSGADQTRDLTTILVDTLGNSTLSSNQFTLQAGTYRIQAYAPATAVNVHRAWLFNVTDSIEQVGGSNAYATAAAPSAFSYSNIDDQFTISSQKTFEIRHRCSTTRASDGFGPQVNSSFTVPFERYTDVQIWKVA